MEVLPVSANWTGESGRMLRLLLDAAAARGESLQTKFIALLTALNAVQLDNIETAALRQQDENAQALLSPLNDIEFPLLGEDGHDEYKDIKAALNYRLLCSAPLSGIAPGNIYNCEDFNSGQTKNFPTVGQLAFDAANPDCKDNHRKLREAGCVPIAMEVSPLCDYQQGGNGFPRFICGLAVPFDQISLLKGKGSVLAKDTADRLQHPSAAGEYGFGVELALHGVSSTQSAHGRRRLGTTPPSSLGRRSSLAGKPRQPTRVSFHSYI